jgi:hypothetical protein
MNSTPVLTYSSNSCAPLSAFQQKRRVNSQKDEETNGPAVRSAVSKIIQEDTMKRNIASTTLVIISVVTLCMGLASAAYAEYNGGCSAASVAGKWGYTYTGTIILPTGAVPVATVGSFTLDTKGNFAASQNRSVGGGYAQETATGTLTVKGDCTGSLNANVYQSGQLVRTAVIDLVFDNNRRHLRAIFQSASLPDGTNLPVVITIDGLRLFRGEGD